MSDTEIIEHVCPKCDATDSFKVTFSYNTDTKDTVLFWAECRQCGHEECLNDRLARETIAKRFITQ